MQCFNRRVYFECLQLCLEPLGFFGDNLFGVCGFVLPLFEVGSDNSLEVIDVIEECTVNVTDISIDVARHRDVNKEHVAVFPFPHDVGEGPRCDEILWCIGGTNDDVGINEEAEVAFVSDGGAAEFFGDFDGAFVGAIRDDDVGNAVGDEMLRREFAHFAGTDNRDGFAFQSVKNFLGEFNGGVADRDSTGSDGSLSADTFADAEGLGKKTVEDRARAASGPRLLIGRFHLPQDLRLADYHGIETGCDTEKVLDCCQSVVAITGLLKSIHADAVVAREKFKEMESGCLGAAARVWHCVNFDSVAGGEDDCLLHLLCFT